jgi:hypothetical protein
MSLAALVDLLASRLALPADATVYPAGSAAFARAAQALAEGARLFDFQLDIDSPDLLVSWPEGRAVVNGTQSLDAFAACCLTIPEVARCFDGATAREGMTEDEESALAALLEQGAIVDAPLVLYALGATLAHHLERHAGARWLGGDTVDVAAEAPPGVRIHRASIQFPFAAARDKMADPRNSLWTKRFSLLEAPPPRGLAGTLDEARERWPLLLPDGALPLLEGWQELGVERALAELELLMDRHPESGLLVAMSIPIACQLDDLSRAVALCRRLCRIHPHVNSKFGLADTLGCMDEPEARAEAEALFHEVLAEQPMMTRARLKLGLLLAESDRTDAAIEHFREVAGTWGKDAEEARGYLEQLGVTLEEG